MEFRMNVSFPGKTRVLHTQEGKETESLRCRLYANVFCDFLKRTMFGGGSP